MRAALVDHPVWAALLVLLLWVLVYTVYKVSWRRDFGLPVRRRLLCRGLQVERERVAYVPFWWTDIQVQRAVDAYWKRMMRRGVERRGHTAV